jgi:hypothetical protein
MIITSLAGNDRRQRIQDEGGFSGQSMPWLAEPLDHVAARRDPLHSVQDELQGGTVNLWRKVNALDSDAQFLQWWIQVEVQL